MKNKSILIRVSADEKEHLKKLAGTTPISVYIRKRLFGDVPRPVAPANSGTVDPYEGLTVEPVDDYPA